MSNSLEEASQRIIEDTVQSMNCVLWGIESVAHGKGSLLRIYIDKIDAEVDIDDCVNVSRQLDLVLAVNGTTSREYTLEVSSPGLDRVFFSLQQLVDYHGQLLKINLISAIDGRKRFQGRLEQVNLDKNSFVVEVDKESVEIPFSLVRMVRLRVDF